MEPKDSMTASGSSPEEEERWEGKRRRSSQLKTIQELARSGKVHGEDRVRDKKLNRIKEKGR